MSLELHANHVQITYYFGIFLAGFIIVQIIEHLKFGQIKPLVFALLAFGGGATIGLANHTMRLWSNAVYSSETIRGKTELTSNKESKGGLDRDYAFSYSYGIGETGTLLIPNLYGGASGGSLGGKKSETLKVMVNAGIPEDGATGFQNMVQPNGATNHSWAGQIMLGQLSFSCSFWALSSLKLIQNGGC